MQSQSEPPHAVEFSCTPQLQDPSTKPLCRTVLDSSASNPILSARLFPTAVWTRTTSQNPQSRHGWNAERRVPGSPSNSLDGWRHTYHCACMHAGRLESAHHITLQYTAMYVHAEITYIRTYIHTYIHKCIRAYIHTSMRAYIHTYIHTLTHIDMHTYIPIYIPTCARICVSMCVHAPVYVSCHVCIDVISCSAIHGKVLHCTVM